jgi:hypothetical protein
MFAMSLSDLVAGKQWWQTMYFHDIETRSTPDKFYELLQLKKLLEFVYVITLQCNKRNSSSINASRHQWTASMNYVSPWHYRRNPHQIQAFSQYIYVLDSLLLFLFIYRVNARLLPILSTRIEAKKKNVKESYSIKTAAEALAFVSFEGRTFSRQFAQRWMWGCQPYAPAGFIPPPRPQEDSCYSILLEAEPTTGP